MTVNNGRNKKIRKANCFLPYGLQSPLTYLPQRAIYYTSIYLSTPLEIKQKETRYKKQDTKYKMHLFGYCPLEFYRNSEDSVPENL